MILNSILALVSAQSTMPGDSIIPAGNVVSAAENAATQAAQELSVWELCLKGGFIMIPLVIMALISIYVLVERYLAIKAAAKEDSSFMKRIKDYILEGEIESAINLCKKTNTPCSRLIEKGITRIGRPTTDVQAAIENVGNLEIARLEKGFPWLATTAAGAPMLGFLGTVTGMVSAFFALASAGGSANISILANGIYEALVTTVAGLVVGVIALFAYNFLVAKVNNVMTQLEAKTLEFMDILNEPAE